MYIKKYFAKQKDKKELKKVEKKLIKDYGQNCFDEIEDFYAYNIYNNNNISSVMPKVDFDFYKENYKNVGGCFLITEPEHRKPKPLQFICLQKEEIFLRDNCLMLGEYKVTCNKIDFYLIIDFLLTEKISEIKEKANQEKVKNTIKLQKYLEENS